VRREFRGVWIATVNNIDWPSRRDLTVEQQKAELIELFDRARALNLNAIIFQVRPAVDALYDSKLEPWSEYLTGKMGQAPQPFYDPLAFAVTEAHRRGMELHAWFNPYRARFANAKGEIAASHLSRTRPELVRQYGKSMWLDPSEPQVQDHTTQVILDVVRRYDIDAVHFDDYFYPYQEKDADNKIIDFPDAANWERYQKTGGKLSRSDWRREQVNTLVSRLSTEIKAIKPWVRFGISPFGIWRPGYPAQIKGLDAYEDLYADSRKWLTEGWVDYFTPQLYWKIEAPAQSFPVLLNWWTQQNVKSRHLWPGHFTARAVEKTANVWPDEEIEYQIRATRGQAGVTGSVHFSAKSLLREDLDGLTKRLATTVYAEEALAPASPWLSSGLPTAPEALTIAPERTLRWRAAGTVPAWLWVMQYRHGNTWKTHILPGSQTNFTLPTTTAETSIAEVAVSAINRVGIQSPLTRLSLTAVPATK
jgi:uncharacterized lipoprotein YddW (UPF0748 family)